MRNITLKMIAKVPNPDYIKYVLRTPDIQIYVDIKSGTGFFYFGDYLLIFNELDNDKITYFEKKLTPRKKTEWFKTKK